MGLWESVPEQTPEVAVVASTRKEECNVPVFENTSNFVVTEILLKLLLVDRDPPPDEHQIGMLNSGADGIRGVMRFGRTCKRFRNLVRESPEIWRQIDLALRFNEPGFSSARVAAVLRNPMQIAWCQRLTKTNWLTNAHVISLLTVMKDIRVLSLTLAGPRSVESEILQLLSEDSREQLREKKVTVRMVVAVIEAMTNLEELHMDDRLANESELAPITFPASLRKFRALRVTGRKGPHPGIRELIVTSENIHGIIHECPNLTSLKIENLLPPRELEMICASSPCLTSFEAQFAWYSAADLSALSTCKGLRSVAIIASSLTDGSIDILCHGCPNIEALFITLSSVTRKDVLSLSGLRNLRQLRLFSTSNTELSEAFSIFGASEGVPLRSLSLQRIEFDQVPVFSEPRFSGLRDVHFHGCSFSEEEFQRLAMNCKETLVDAEISTADECCVALLRECHRLETFSVSVLLFADELLGAIGEQSKAPIQRFTASGPITDTGLLLVARALASATLVRLNGPNCTKNGLEGLARRCPHLEKLVNLGRTFFVRKH